MKKSSYKLSLRHKDQSPRQLRVGQLINASVMNCLRRGRMLDPLLINCPISITSVVVSADLQIASCFFVPFNTSLSKDEILDALHKSRNIIRKSVTEDINLKFSPEIRFFYDESFLLDFNI